MAQVGGEDPYQKLIAQADALLSSGERTEALALFQEAAALRPDHAYPRVKIGELERKAIPPVQHDVDQVMERQYWAGRAHVLERTVQVEGRPVVYSRTRHPHGSVHYFRDGRPVAQRMWTDLFGAP